MDIIITGEQGAGKTREAQRIIANYRPLYGKRLADADVIYIHDMHDTPGPTCEMLRSFRVRAVVFDGCIIKPADMIVAVQAVKEYRKQIGTDVLAIYVAQGDAVMLTDGVLTPLTNEFKADRNLTAEHTQRREDGILADLWDTLAEKVDETDSLLMQSTLDRICNARVPENAPATCWGLHHLDPQGKTVMLEFLLTLLRKYE